MTKEYDDLEELIFREILEIMEKEKGEKEVRENYWCFVYYCHFDDLLLSIYIINFII